MMSSDEGNGPEGELDLARLVTRGFESPDLDYKAPGGWTQWSDAEKAELIRDLASMGNSHRPGWIIIGVEEGDAGTFVGAGITDDQASGFDPTPIGLWAKNYIDPPIQFRIHKPRLDGRLYAAIQVQPFQTVPHVCVRNYGSVLHEAAIYIRTDACQTAKISNAAQMRALIDRATTNSADALVARIDEIYRRAGSAARLSVAATDARALFGQQLREIEELPGGAS